MGDPSGIGPEVIVKAFSDPGIFEICRPIIFGDAWVLFRSIKAYGQGLIHEITEISEAEGKIGILDLIPVSNLNEDHTRPGKAHIEGGKAMVDFIFRAVQVAQMGKISAVVTCPINKILMHDAGYDYEGHTQLIAQLTHTEDYVMMLAGGKLRVALVTIHCALREVPHLLEEEKIYKTIRITAEGLQKDLGISEPHIAVAALNPHGGEGGLFGLEEEEIIKPAINRAKHKGYNVEGPFPADTLFPKAASGQFDAVVTMYHDQGLIPLKLLHFSDAVNITLGLPIIRTSVDHGTAYDIAGKGLANPTSLKAAIRMSVAMTRNRNLRKW